MKPLLQRVNQAGPQYRFRVMEEQRNGSGEAALSTTSTAPIQSSHLDMRDMRRLGRCGGTVSDCSPFPVAPSSVFFIIPPPIPIAHTSRLSDRTLLTPEWLPLRPQTASQMLKQSDLHQIRHQMIQQHCLELRQPRWMRGPRRRGHQLPIGHGRRLPQSQRSGHRENYLRRAGRITAHFLPSNHSCRRENLRRVADRRNRLVRIGKVTDDLQHLFVQPQILRRTSTRNDQAVVILGLYLGKSGINTKLCPGFSEYV